MEREIKYAKYLTEEQIIEFLESTNSIRVNKNKKPYIKFGKHEIILIGGALIEKYQTIGQVDKNPEYKEMNFMCVLNDFQCKLTLAGAGPMANGRKLLLKRKYAEYLLAHIPENLRDDFIIAYNSQLKDSQENSVHNNREFVIN